MKPLFVLLGTFGLCLLAAWLYSGHSHLTLSAKVAMSVMLMFTVMGHFRFTKGMAMMLPRFIPCKTLVVYATGVFEILAAIGLLIPRFSSLTGWLLLLFFILILPANISAAMRRVDHEKGTLTGKGTRYLWFRVPLQILFIAWVYFAVLF